MCTNGRWKCGIIAPFRGEEACHGQCVKSWGFVSSVQGGKGVCKSMQLQCHKSGGNVHSWGLKDGVGIYLEEQVEETRRVSALLHFADIWRPANEDHGL